MFKHSVVCKHLQPQRAGKWHVLSKCCKSPHAMNNFSLFYISTEQCYLYTWYSSCYIPVTERRDSVFEESLCNMSLWTPYSCDGLHTTSNKAKHSYFAELWLLLNIYYITVYNYAILYSKRLTNIKMILCQIYKENITYFNYTKWLVL